MSRFANPALALWCVYLIQWPIVGFAQSDTPVTPPPTDREAKILAALGDVTEIDFAEQPLSDVVEYLKIRHEIEIQLDNRALTDAGIGSDTPITRTLKDISLRSILRLVLSELDLTYLVGDGYLLITSKTEAENMLHFRVYPVADLVTTGGNFRPALEAGAKGDVDFKNLTDVLSMCVAPTTWGEVGGPGSLEGHRNSRTLTVSQTDEAQEEVAQMLAALRRVRDKQLAAAKPVDPFGKWQPPAEEPMGAFGLRVHRLAAAPPKTAAKPITPPLQPAQQPAQQPPPAADKKDADNDEKKVDTKDATPPATIAASPETTNRDLENIARELARAVPNLIDEESWQPAGPGKIQAVGNTLLVWHHDEVQSRVARLIEEILPGGASQSVAEYYPAVRLAPPAIRTAWPREEDLNPNEKHAAIVRALDQPTTLDFADQPLSDVVDFLKKKHEIEIQLDNRALTDAGIGSDTPITRTLDGLALKTVLKLILNELDLTYVIRNEVLMITSKTEAESMLVAKIYPVFDLVVRPVGASPRTPGMDFQGLIKNITGQISPPTWGEAGGPGEIKEFINAGALVIAQTAAVHEEIAAYLQALRQSAATQN